MQVNTLIYCLGEKSEDNLAFFRQSAEDSGKYDVVKKKFDYFVIRKNVIFERATFNRRAQEECETVDEFVTRRTLQLWNFGRRNDSRQARCRFKGC